MDIVGLTKKQLAAWQAVAATPGEWMAQEEVAQAADMHSNYARIALRELADKGLVERSRHGAFWRALATLEVRAVEVEEGR